MFNRIAAVIELMYQAARERSNSSFYNYPVCFLVPDEALIYLSRTGDEVQKRSAINTIAESNRVRGQRGVISSLSGLLTSATNQMKRTIYDAKHSNHIADPNDLILSEGGAAPTDTDVKEAYDYSGEVYKFYKEVFNRSSFDDNNAELISTVHWSESFKNALWNGTSIIYGDGFTKSIDAIGHELTHAVTQYTSHLVYQNESGALNEHMSDVMGILIKQRYLKQSVNESDWLIGENLIPGLKALRSLKEPGTAYPGDIQPGHMKDYLVTSFDHGAVHTNSGIPNKAFYLIASDIGGNAWQEAGMIWYFTLRDRLRPQSTFQDFANLTFEVAGVLYGQNGKEQSAVRKGWTGVGITVNEDTKQTLMSSILLKK